MDTVCRWGCRGCFLKPEQGGLLAEKLIFIIISYFFQSDKWLVATFVKSGPFLFEFFLNFVCGFRFCPAEFDKCVASVWSVSKKNTLSVESVSALPNRTKERQASALKVQEHLFAESVLNRPNLIKGLQTSATKVQKRFFLLNRQKDCKSPCGEPIKSLFVKCVLNWSNGTTGCNDLPERKTTFPGCRNR